MGAEPVPRPRSTEPAPADRADDHPSFDEVYESYFEFVWRTLRRLGLPDTAAEDAAQEVFVVVHRKLATFEGRSTVRTWLYGIARRVAKDHRRAASRRMPVEELPSGLTGEGPGPDERLVRQEGARILEGLLDRLDPVKRETFILAELEEMTAPEIAAAMGTTTSTVYTRVSAARAAFNRAVRRWRARNRRTG
ncbi:MAG: RNA polymerase sigma factor [Sandaracinaceae bacterium]